MVLLFGILAALVAGRSLATLLYGLKSSDPITILGATVLLLLVAAVAAYRASRLDPMVALRYE